MYKTGKCYDIFITDMMRYSQSASKHCQTIRLAANALTLTGESLGTTTLTPPSHKWHWDKILRGVKNLHVIWYASSDARMNFFFFARWWTSRLFYVMREWEHCNGDAEKFMRCKEMKLRWMSSETLLLLLGSSICSNAFLCNFNKKKYIEHSLCYWSI